MFFLSSMHFKGIFTSKIPSIIIGCIYNLDTLYNGFTQLVCSHFSEAVVAIEKVAEHINEMQRITEQFSPVFHELIKEFGVFEVK